MRNREVVAYKNRLDSLFDKIRAISESDASIVEMQAHWASYLCVLTSGFLEVAIRAIYGDYLQQKCRHRAVVALVQRRLAIHNPKMQKIIELADAINPEWATELRAKTDGELKDAIDSIVANRNSISHGQPAGMSYVRMKDYYEKVVKVIELIEEQCTR